VLVDVRAFDWLILVATITVGGMAVAARVGGTIPSRPNWPQMPSGRSSWWSALGLVAVVASGYAWTAERNRSPGESHAGIVAAWLISTAALILAVWRPSTPEVVPRGRAWAGVHRLDLGIAAIVTGLAAVPMVFRLSSYPWAFNGDEGQFALSAKAILDGNSVDPFGTGWLGHPNLYFYLEAGAMRLAGESVEGARLASAILGILAVPLAYAFAAHLFSRTAGVIAAVLLGTFHVHLFWSRSALNNGASTFFVLLTLFLLSIALEHQCRIAFLLTGMAAGLAQYFYMGNRAIPLAVGAILLLDAALIMTKQDRPLRQLAVILGGLGLAVGGALVVIMPLASHFSRFPEEFDARGPAVSIFRSGWVDHQHELGRTSLEIFAGQLRDAAMIPFTTHVGGQYRGLPPFIGWPMAMAAFAGLVIAAARIRTLPFRLVTVTYGIFAVSVATTVPPMATNRFVIGTPLICIFAAIAITTGHDLLIRARAPKSLAVLAAGLATGLIAAWSLVYYFQDPNQVEISSDPNTQVSEYLGRDILAIDPAALVYFAGPPRMWYRGFGNLVFRTPDVVAVSVEQPWTPSSPKPETRETTIFVVLPERETELDVIRDWFPDGETFQRSDEALGPLYTAYIVHGPPGPDQ
jgi:hypothetical protein